MSANPNTFGRDIFISYSHLDMEWVDALQERLDKRLRELLGEPPEIWRDLKLRGNDDFAHVLVLKLSQTAFLVTVVSPGYVKSDWCVEELEEFCRNAAKNGGIRVNNKSRIFKVIKSPIEDFDCPKILQELLQECLDYAFYEWEKMSGRLFEYRHDLGVERCVKFWEKIEDLAIDIRAFVRWQQANSRAKSVYLAETTPDLSEARDGIKRELLLNDFHVFPDEYLPFEGPIFEEKVRGYLKQSVLSIHLVGSDYAAATGAEKNKNQPVVDAQHQLAAERVRRQHELAMAHCDEAPEYARLIWMPEKLEACGESYGAFITKMRNDPAVYDRAEVFCGGKLEDFKTAVQKRLSYRHQEDTKDDVGKRIYLNCDRQDVDLAAPLRDHLTGQGYKVILPFKDTSEVRSDHTENVRRCDSLLIFYGRAESTVSGKLEELPKIEKVHRDGKPLLATGVYVGGPETEHKRTFKAAETLVMKNFGEFSPESVRPFLEAVERQARGAGA
jgi:hypothetical protein